MPENTFLTQWQAQMPGVGHAYQVDTSMLCGVAVAVADKTNNNNNSSHCAWVYMPNDTWGTNAAACFAALFAVQSAWDLETLQPYLERLAVATGQTHEQLLLQHAAKTTTATAMGTMYMAKSEL